jgi:carbon-monoxide dehydrogenase iron sulfur subunit
MKTVFINPERCIGCKHCEIACAVEHSESKNLYQAVFEEPLPRPHIHVEPGLHLNTSFPNKCRHCDPAPCMQVCPSGAISRSDDLSEIVVVDGNKCILCGMCGMVCPFDVITYGRTWTVRLRRDVAIKCDHCIDRQREGRIPACAEACKVEALQFGEINELVKAARTRLSEAVSVAVGEIRPEVTLIPENVGAWRELGEEISQLGR